MCERGNLRRRNVGETRRGKTKSYIFSPFSFNTQKIRLREEASTVTCQGQAKIGEILVKYQGKSSLRQYRSKIKPIRQHLEVPWQYRSKNGEHVSIDRKNVHKSTCKSANLQ